MNVTATLLGQMITFAILVWFINHYLWGPLTAVMEGRKNRISDGLAAAEKGHKEQVLAEKIAKQHIREAKQQSAELIAHAQNRSDEIIEEAKLQARDENEKILAAGRVEVDREIQSAREHLRIEVADLAILAAEKILVKEIDQSAHNKMLDSLIKQL